MPPETPVKVGELACQKDTSLTQLTVRVMHCTRREQKEKPKKDAAQPPSEAYEVVFSDSVLFPEGGGQPCDHGSLCVVDGSGQPVDEASSTISVTEVLRRGDTCVVISPVAFPVGAMVRQTVDWGRRLDHAQHHTAQHLLSAVIEQELGLPTVSWSLTHPTCFVQLELAELLSASNDNSDVDVAEKKLSHAAVQRVMDRCNDRIAKNAPVRCHIFPSKEEYYASLENTTGGQDTIRSRGIPDDVNGAIRLIEIDGVDNCTCCGTHLSSLSQLHCIQFLHQECKNTTVKLHFVTGQRALQLFTDMYFRERALVSEMGGAKPTDLVFAAQKRAKDLADREKKMKRWSTELAEASALRINSKLKEISLASAENTTNRVVVVSSRRDDVDSDFFTALRSAISAPPGVALVFLFAWSITPSATHTVCPTKDITGQFMITSDAVSTEVLDACVEVAKATVPDLKGGLSKQGFRGKGSLREWNTLLIKLQETYSTVS